MQLSARFIFSLLVVCLLLPYARSASAETKAHHVVFALTSPDDTDWKVMINNIHSLQMGFGPENVDVEVVAFGPGIVFLKNDSSELSEIKELETAHVHFMACNNSMKARHWTQADLVPGADVVPSGIVEVVTKEEKGWSYIKAGR